MITHSVIWGDGDETFVNDDGRLQRIYPASPSLSANAVYPITVQLTDDDTGLGKYRFERMVVDWNNDDDDKNGVPDHLDVHPSPLEDDLVMLDLTGILQGYVTNDDGTVYLQYSYDDIAANNEQSTAIRIWLQADKGGVPWQSIDSMYGRALPAGVTTVWVEGTKVGTDTIYVSWQPKDLDANLIPLGEVAVKVMFPLGKLKAEESYWGTPNQWYSTDDDDILWRHNQHRISFSVPEGFDLSRITSYKLYSIPDDDIQKISFPGSSHVVQGTIYTTVDDANAILLGSTSRTNIMPINLPGGLINLPDGKHNIFGIFEYQFGSTTSVRLTNLLTKAVIGVKDRADAN